MPEIVRSDTLFKMYQKLNNLFVLKSLPLYLLLVTLFEESKH